jgi:hypothetical protein
MKLMGITLIEMNQFETDESGNEVVHLAFLPAQYLPDLSEVAIVSVVKKGMNHDDLLLAKTVPSSAVDAASPTDLVDYRIISSIDPADAIVHSVFSRIKGVG